MTDTAKPTTNVLIHEPDASSRELLGAARLVA